MYLMVKSDFVVKALDYALLVTSDYHAKSRMVGKPFSFSRERWEFPPSSVPQAKRSCKRCNAHLSDYEFCGA